LADAANRIDAKIESSTSNSTVAVREAARIKRAIEQSRSLLKPVLVPLGSGGGASAAVSDLKIGLISRRVSLQKEVDQVLELELFEPEIAIQGVSTDPYYKLTAPSDIDRIEAGRAYLLEQLGSLARLGANVIAVSELGYPAFITPNVSRFNLDDEDRLRQGDSRFREEVQKLADQYGTLIIPGTYHDPRKIGNYAMIFYPNALEPIYHQKLTTAKSDGVGEIIRPPRTPKYNVYDCHVGVVAVLICMDAFDLNTLSRYIFSGMQGSMERRPDLVIVPAMSPISLHKSCEDLSYFARTTVAYVNASCEPYTAVYVAGKEIHVGYEKREHVIDIPWSMRDPIIQEANDRHQNGIFSSSFATSVTIA
jgi:predicted amidohydrolase